MSRYRELRERVAQKWARRAIAALAIATREMGKRWTSTSYDSDITRNPDDYMPRAPRCMVEWSGSEPTEPYCTPTLSTEDGATSLRTLYPQLASHPRFSRARAERLAAPLGVPNAEHLLRSECAWADANLAIHRDLLHPELYVAPIFTPRPPAPPSDAVVMSTTYTREVGADEDGARVVAWKAQDDPMHDALRRGRATREQIALERATDAWLRENDPCVGRDDDAAADHRDAVLTAVLDGKVAPDRPRLIRLDVIDRWTHLPTVSPDRVAFRGVSRRRAPSPVRYRVSRPATIDSADAIASCTLGIVPRTLLEYRTDRVGGGFAWIGHRKITTGPAVREARRASKRRAATTLKRGDATSKRGVAVNAWNLSDRSMPRAWSKADAGQVAFATTLVQILTTLNPDVVTELGEGFTVQTDGASAWLIGEHGPSRTYPLQQFARRAALAREDVA